MKERYGRVFVVVGMQYGSEGKGAVAAYLSALVSVAVRTGAANAGHTIYHQGRRFVMQQLPVAWVNPVARLVIGAGALISKEILLREIEMVDSVVPVRKRIYIDRAAHVITGAQVVDELKTDLASRIGSTSARSSEGIGTARAAKVMRRADCLTAAQVPELTPYLADTVDLVNSVLERDDFCMLEGAQGLGLSLEHGYFPYVTSIDTSAMALAASAGVALHEFPLELIGVCRTYPIRVAGTSGPFDPDSHELTWEAVTAQAGAPEIIREKTSVTGMVRRVATFSMDGFERSCRINRPNQIAVTFCDYLDWAVYGVTAIDALTDPVRAFVEELESVSGIPVTLIGTGPESIIDFDPYRSNIIRRIGP